MAITSRFSVVQEFEVFANVKDVYNFLIDIPKNLELHPNTHAVHCVEEDVYQVLMRKIGTQKYNFQPSYTCVYRSMSERYGLTWEPVGADEALRVNGRFDLEGSPSSDKINTRVIMNVVSEMDMSIPRILKSAATKFVANDNLRTSKAYANNIIDRFGGGRIVKSDIS